MFDNSIGTIFINGNGFDIVDIYFFKNEILSQLYAEQEGWA